MTDSIKIKQWKAEAWVHWNMAFVGGVLGVYAILLHMGNFGSAQTGNLMEMADSLISGEWQDVLLRFLTLPCFGAGVVAAYLLSNDTKVNVRKLALILDALGMLAASLIPLKPVMVGLYPIFFCSAFQWGVFSSTNGYNSATIFSSNNFKQAVLGWTQYIRTKDREFKQKAILYTNTVVFFFVGACYGAWAVHLLEIHAVYLGFLPLITGWIVVEIARNIELAAEAALHETEQPESETPQEFAREAEVELQDAELLESETPRKFSRESNQNS